MEKWPDERINEKKEILAFELTKLVHGEEEAVKARDASRALFTGSISADSENIPSTQVTLGELEEGIGLIDLMKRAGLTATNSDARRLIEQGGLTLNGEKVTDAKRVVTQDDLEGGYILLRKGKKVYHKITAE